MLILPVDVAEDGTISARGVAPEGAITTFTTPLGVWVYEKGDEALLAERLPAQEVIS